MRIAMLSVVCTLAGLAFGQYGVDRGGPEERDLERREYDRSHEDRSEDWDRSEYGERSRREFDEDRYLAADLDDMDAMEFGRDDWDEVELEGMLDDELSMRDDDDRGPPPAPHHRGFRGPGRGDGPPPHAGRRPPRHEEADEDEADDDDDGCPFCERMREMHRLHFAHRGDRDRTDRGGHRQRPGRGPGFHHREMAHEGMPRHRSLRDGRGRDAGCPMCEGRGGGRFEHRRPPHRGEFAHRMPRRGGECPCCRQEGRRSQHHPGLAERGRGMRRGGAGHHPPPPPIHHGMMGRGPRGRGGPPGGHGPQHVFQMLDADKDGKLSKDEVLNLHADQDADKDGLVTLEEIGKHMRSVHKHPDGKKGEPKKLSKAGKNKPKEKKSEVGGHARRPGGPMGHPGRGMMGMLRGRGPGGPFGMLPPHEMMEKMFEKVDADHNGSVTKDEIAEAIWEKAGPADENKDGALSKEEIRKHLFAHLGGGDGVRPDRPRRPEGRPGKRHGKPADRAKPKPADEKAELTPEGEKESTSASKPVVESTGEPPASVEKEANPTEAASPEQQPTEANPTVEAAVTQGTVAESQPEGQSEAAKPVESSPVPAVLPSVDQDKPVEIKPAETGETQDEPEKTS